MTKRPALNNKYPIVYVEWEDSSADGGWDDEAETLAKEHGNDVAISVGMLVRETPDMIILVSSAAESTGQIGNKQFIPKGSIKQFVLIRKSKTPHKIDKPPSSLIAQRGKTT